MNRRPPSLVWKEPPPITRGRPSRLQPIVEALQARPGEWAMVAANRPRHAANTMTQRLKKLGCEATQRTNGEGTEVYARWPT
jgi:hypothetical protein